MERGLIMGVGRMIFFSYFTGTHPWDGVYFLQLILGFIDRNFGVVFDTLGSDRDLWERELSVPGLGGRKVRKARKKSPACS